MEDRWQVMSNIKPQIRNRKKRQRAILSALFNNRGLASPKEIEEFLNPRLSLSTSCLPLPQKSLAKATTRIKQAISAREPIVVYGDYDCDGICATAILWETLHNLGAKVAPFIPDRTQEGYGLSEKGIDNVISQTSNVRLIITVDNGIGGLEEVGYAKSKGIDVIITDHHTPLDKLPKAYAIVHTTELSGAAIAWLVAQSLIPDLPPTRPPDAQGSELPARFVLRSKASGQPPNSHLALVAIATIADLVPLLGLSRTLTKLGLEKLSSPQRVGLKALINEAGLAFGRIGTYEVGWIIAPRLNATGRLTSAMDGLRLLCTRNLKQAEELAQKLGELNQERQRLTDEATTQAKELILSHKPLANLIFVSHKSFDPGVIGIVAARLVDEFYRPAIVVARGERESKASARSIPGFDIGRAIRACSDLLIDGGGHPMAAGFTVETEKLLGLKKRLTKIAEDELDEESLTPTLRIDCEVELADLAWDLYEKIRQFEPFGVGNPRPVFMTTGLKLTSIRCVGAEDRHLKLTLDDPATREIEAAEAELALPTPAFDGIGFNLGFWGKDLSPGDIVDVVFALDKNVWNGQEILQLKVKDLRKTKL